MVPMALGLGEGGEQNAPLGRGVIGGLILATVATLVFVPTVFAFIHGRRPRGSSLGPTFPLETLSVAQTPQTSRRARTGILLLSGAALAIGAAGSGIRSRQHSEAELLQVTDAAAEPTVAVALAVAAPAEEEVVLPGTVQAAYDRPIYARTSGYVKHP
jgi:hypothetical protein